MSRNAPQRNEDRCMTSQITAAKETISNYSQLSFNGHLYKTDTWCWPRPRPFLSHFTVAKEEGVAKEIYSHAKIAYKASEIYTGGALICLLLLKTQTIANPSLYCWRFFRCGWMQFLNSCVWRHYHVWEHYWFLSLFMQPIWFCLRWKRLHW